MSFALADTMPFGKYKGQKVNDILKDDPGYLCWLRDTKKSEGQADPFKIEVHTILDNTIEATPSLKKKYRPWNKKAVDLQEVMASNKARAGEIEERRNAAEKAEEERDLAYAREWASW